MKIWFTCVLALFLQCSYAQSKAKNPIRNFEHLWNRFNDRYANFELKGVDWQQVYEEYRPMVTAETSPEELFDICCQMMQTLNDGHVSIDPRFKENDIECGPPYDFYLFREFSTREDRLLYNQAIQTTLDREGFGEKITKDLAGDTNFQYRLSDDWVYLRMDEMTESPALGKFSRTLDECLEAAQNSKGMILDFRLNGGGLDIVGYRLASRLIEPGQTVSHYERKRIKGTDEYTELKERTIEAKGKYPFTKPIVILTGDFTASAAEVFLLLVKDLPYVTLIGDPTEGIFSDMQFFRMPNGWWGTLSHQQYFDGSNTNYEGEGIPVDINIRNTLEGAQKGEDEVILKALEVLQAIN
ncbi:MAG: S41 family peptidase [Bacteroidota bacterium]